MSLSDFLQRALTLLARETARGVLVRPQVFGELLWPDRKVRGSTCSAPLARPAGKALNDLKTRRLAEFVTEGSGRDIRWGWRCTTAGIRQAGDEYDRVLADVLGLAFK